MNKTVYISDMKQKPETIYNFFLNIVVEPERKNKCLNLEKIDFQL